MPVVAGVGGVVLIAAALWFAWPYLPFNGDTAHPADAPPQGGLIEEPAQPSEPATEFTDDLDGAREDERENGDRPDAVVVTDDPIVLDGDMDLSDVDDEMRRMLDDLEGDFDEFVDGGDGELAEVTFSGEAYETTNWVDFRPVGGDVTFAIEMPMDWFPDLEGWIDGSGTTMAMPAPGLVLLHSGQGCLDSYRGPPGGSREARNSLSGANPAVVEIWRVSGRTSPHYVYCVEEKGYAFEVTFFGASGRASDEEMNLFGHVVGSFRVLDEP